MLTEHPLYYLSINAAHNDDYHSRMTEAMNTAPVSAENGQYTYRLANYDGEVQLNCTPFDENTYESITTVRNTGAEPLTLDRLSSGYVAGDRTSVV